MEDNWKGIKEAITSTCQEIPGHMKYHHKEWISIEILENIQEKKNRMTTINNIGTRTEKVKARVEYIEANKRGKRRIRANKQKYVGDLTTTKYETAM